MTGSMILTRYLLVVLLALPAAPSGGIPWDKNPEQWDQADAYRILRDSPWTPAEIKLESAYTDRRTDPQSGIVTNSPLNPENTGRARGIEIAHNKELPAVAVLWWSAKIVRLAKQRLFQLRNPSAASQPLRADDLPDLVVAIEGSEQLRILRDAKEDLHDTVFLELPDGLPLDLQSIQFIEGADEDDVRAEFHFARQVDGNPSLDADAERVRFHCKATAKTPRQGEQNVISLRAEFHPNRMRARNQPDF
jgi:hypothetical protein